ncbi:MAG: protein kinase, partial [Gemmatimonadales bacterium]
MTERPLTPTRMAEMQACFEQALDATPGDREAILLDITVRDPDLGARVRALLAAHEDTSDALASPLREAALRTIDAGRDPWIGERVGNYLVERRIGEGGMGTVYEAVRADDQFRKRVAIKLIRQHASGEAAVRRFRDERQILASLHHPNIAVLL